MLSIDREIGEKVYIGDVELEVVGILERSALIRIGEKSYTIKSGSSLTFDVTEIFYFKNFNNQKTVRLGFDGPRSVTILRGELYNKKKDKQPKYIDNATKQFPSGDF